VGAQATLFPEKQLKLIACGGGQSCAVPSARVPI
jgi:hypothetical protein